MLGELPPAAEAFGVLLRQALQLALEGVNERDDEEVLLHVDQIDKSLEVSTDLLQGEVAVFLHHAEGFSTAFGHGLRVDSLDRLLSPGTTCPKQDLAGPAPVRGPGPLRPLLERLDELVNQQAHQKLTWCAE